MPLDYILNHPNYEAYKNYLHHWKEEFNESSEDRANKIAYIFGLSLTGHGDRRVCLYKDNKILKLPLESCHYESNENEVYLYNYIKENHKDLIYYLCPVLEYTEGIILTEYCQEFGYDMTDDDLLDICEKYKSIFAKVGVELTDLDGPQQLGVFDNMPVILDYEDYAMEEF